ncbi:MAG TPA: dual specificity protein phosphatase 23 [Ktedonobacteraceae bacterium]|nr:dual specificity protein phosphatase 23 [Ktedonobacteraceae bacterium]
MSIEVLREVKVRANLDPDFRGQLLKSPMKFLQNYDLTEDEKREVILPNFSWLVEHKLAAMSYPESEDAFTLLSRIGIRALINLTEEPLSGEILRKVGILTEYIPIVDFTAPTLKQVEQAIMMINFYIERNMPVAVHCLAGLGRTGTILACYLVGEGKSADEAITIIRRWRPGSIETLDQEAVIHEYEQFRRSVG